VLLFLRFFEWIVRTICFVLFCFLFVLVFHSPTPHDMIGIPCNYVLSQPNFSAILITTVTYTVILCYTHRELFNMHTTNGRFKVVNYVLCHFTHVYISVSFGSCSRTYSVNEDKSYNIPWNGYINYLECTLSFHGYDSSHPLDEYEVCIKATTWSVEDPYVHLKYKSGAYGNLLEKVHILAYENIFTIHNDFRQSIII